MHKTCFWLVLMITVFSTNAFALVCNNELITIGVLAYRPVPETLAKWKPLEAYFEERIPNCSFKVQALVYDDLNWAVASRQVDFILTNPGHYIALKQQYNLSSPLTSLVKTSQGHALSAFAGVIFTLSTRFDINELKDLANKKIAVTKTASLGGYQMQVFTLKQAGFSLPKEENLLLTGMPHDKVVYAVLEGRVDVGFVRTGVLEAMALEKDLDLSRLKIINAQAISSFPYRLSTRLYPEWPFAALSHIDHELASHFTSALLMLHDHQVAKQIGVKGFQIPSDYSPVEDVLRALRFPPFADAPDFTVRDIWFRYLKEIVWGFIVLLMFMILGIYLILLSRRLAAQKQKIKEVADKHHAMLSSLAEGVYGVNSEGYCIFINPSALALFGYQEQEVVGKDQHQLFHHHHQDNKPYPGTECPVAMTINDGQSRHCEDVFWGKNGRYFHVMVNIAALQISVTERGAIVAFRDISAEKQMTDRNEMLVAALEASQTSVVITNKQAEIEWVNPAFEKLTGYQYDEAVGRKPSDLFNSGKQNGAFYTVLWETILAGNSWKGEIVNRRKDGSLYDEELSISPVVDKKGAVTHFIAAKNDISERKRFEKRMQHMAEHDALTGLPNRNLLSDLLTQAIKMAKRNNKNVALMFLDLDEFKPVNDDYGHDVGDELLKMAAQRIAECLRQSDAVARVGGDEFIILLPEVRDAQDALLVAEKIRHSLSLRFDYKENRLHISSSIGIALYPLHGSNEINLAKNADIAMYQAKMQGRNNVKLFQFSMVAK